MKIKDLKEKKNSSIQCLGDITIYNDGKLGSNINYSSILSRLIIEAGRKCKSYASDLFVSWSSLLEKISNASKENCAFSEYFGFREMGVDHEKFIKCRLDGGYGDKPYESIFRIDVDFDFTRKSIKMNLVELV